MQFLTKSLMVGSLLAAGAFADLPIAIPAVTPAVSTTYGVTLDSTSASAKQIKSLSGATFYKGVASSAGLTETTAGELSLQYSLVYSAKDGSGAYGTSVGFLIPIDAAWDIKDLSKATSISYQIKAATAGVTTHLIIGSDSYPTDVAAENASLVSPASLALTTAYQTVSVVPGTDLAMPTWMQSADGASVGWIADGVTTTISIAKKVKDLNIQPILDAAWNSTGTGFKAGTTAVTANTLTITNIMIKGVSLYADVVGASCTGATYVTLDDFAATATAGPKVGVARKAADPNYFGGYWYAFTDTDNTVADNNTAPGDSALGRSKVVLPTGTLKWNPTVGAGAFLTAQLEKNDSISTFMYHPYAGWADIGTNLNGSTGPGDTSYDLQNLASGNALTGIAFTIYGGAQAAAVIPGATFDTTNVQRVIFKVGRGSVNDAEPFQISIPLDQVLTPNGATICVDVTALAQPSWFTPAAVWQENDLTKLSWEIKIENQNNPAIHATSVPSTFGVANIQLYGVAASDLSAVSAIKGVHSALAGLKVTYGSGLVLSYSVAGTSAQVDVVRLDGSKVASFKEGATAQNLSLPVSLSHGSYLVSVRGANSRLVSELAVAR